MLKFSLVRKHIIQQKFSFRTLSVEVVTKVLPYKKSLIKDNLRTNQTIQKELNIGSLATL